MTPKQEAFCMAYIENGGNASEAYRKCYRAENMKSDVINVKACELLKSGKVAVRIKELKAIHVERHKVTVDDLIDELEESRNLACGLPTPQVSAAVSATMGKGKLLGFLDDKPDMSVTNNTLVIMDDNNRLEIARRLAFVLARGAKLAK